MKPQIQGIGLVVSKEVEGTGKPKKMLQGLHHYEQDHKNMRYYAHDVRNVPVKKLSAIWVCMK
jgi:hypothetical protein